VKPQGEAALTDNVLRPVRCSVPSSIYRPETSVCCTSGTIHLPNQSFGGIIIKLAIRILKR
jgi:hypothetical protein